MWIIRWVPMSGHDLQPPLDSTIDFQCLILHKAAIKNHRGFSGLKISSTDMSSINPGLINTSICRIKSSEKRSNRSVINAIPFFERLKIPDRKRGRFIVFVELRSIVKQVGFEHTIISQPDIHQKPVEPPPNPFNNHNQSTVAACLSYRKSRFHNRKSSDQLTHASGIGCPSKSLLKWAPCRNLHCGPFHCHAWSKMYPQSFIGG